MSMKRTNQIALAWILLAGGISIFWGSSLGKPENRWVDFKAVYYGARCLLEHHNPYNVSELDDVYRAEGGESPSETFTAHQTVTLFVNLPTTFIFIAPLAMLPWGAAHVLWIIITAVSLIFAAFLMWNIGADYAPVISVGLICLILANSEVLFLTGNTAGIIVSLCVVAVWCFLNKRFELAGVLCLSVSLAIKPHDAGLVWLFFLLAGHALMDFSLQTDTIAVCKCRRANHMIQQAVPWYYWLTAHALLHGAAVGLVVAMGYPGNWNLIVGFGLAETLIHWVIDYGKCEKLYNIHIDQGLHILCKLVWWGMLAGGVVTDSPTILGTPTL